MDSSTPDSTQNRPAERLQAATGAALVGAGVALTDYLDSPTKRALAYAGLMSAGIGVIGMTTQPNGSRYFFGDDPTLLNDQLRQELGDLGITPGPTSDADNLTLRGPVATWIFIALFLLTTALLIRLDMAVTKRIARFLGARGASRPYTIIGIFYAAVVHASYELDMRMR